MRLAFATMMFWHAIFFSNGEIIAQKSDRVYLKHARQAAHWLDSVAVTGQNGKTWPTVPMVSENSVDILYSGNSGVVLFYLQIYRATNEKQYLKAAIDGANSLANNVSSIDSKANPSFWSGMAGIGYTLSLMAEETKFDRFERASRLCFEFVRSQAQQMEGAKRSSVAWNDVTDMIGGSAGIGMYLLDQFRRTRDQETLKLAVAAGDGLLHLANPVDSNENQLKWMMSPTFPREMPNYSHGTAGICDYLVVLHAHCQDARSKTFSYDGRFLEGALCGARYLKSLSDSRPEHGLIPHHFPEDGPLYYLGWCHGPAGTVSFLDRLAIASGDRQWTKFGDQLVQHLLTCGIPEQRPEGFWNNVGICCGNAGVASFLIDRGLTTKVDRYELLARSLVDDLIRKGTNIQLKGGKTGTFWTHAEHRVRPNFLQAQTGLMQGAAGIGLMLLKMDAATTNSNSLLIKKLPISPF